MTTAPLYLRPGRIGSLELPNRLVRGATSETMASPSGVVYDSFVELYRRLAEGGAGLLLTGHMYVDPRGQASANQTGIHDDRVIPALQRATDAVHEAGGRIFAQIGHCGSQTMMSAITPVAPSPVPNAMYTIQPEELSDGEIRSLVAAFGAAARRAAEAGFDGIHIHGGNGYLISEFCSPHANTRDDRWGGDAERRSRFFFEVAEAVRSAVGDDFPLTARLSVEDSVEGGLQRDESLARARGLAERGIDGFETTYGVMRSYFENIRPYVAVGRAQAWRNLLVQRARQPAGAEAYYRPFARVCQGGVGIADHSGGRRPYHRDDERHPGLGRRRLPGHGPPVHPRAGPGAQAGGRPHRRRRMRLVQHVPGARRLRPAAVLARQPPQRRRTHPQALLDQPPQGPVSPTAAAWVTSLGPSPRGPRNPGSPRAA